MEGHPLTPEQTSSLAVLDDAVTPATKAPSLEDEWLTSIQKSVLDATAFQAKEMVPREKIVGDWFRQGDLGFVFAARGVGKTWFSMHLALCIAESRSFWTWDVPKARRVLYVDGEMSFDGTQKRIASLSKNAGGQIAFLHHEQVFHASGRVLNLTDHCVQKALLRHCLDQQIEVLFLDNLSCLFSGVKENDADSWEQVLPWLLELRRNRIAVVIIHHAGRNGQARGTSRREDSAFWVVKLTESKEMGEERSGAQFISAFTKNRNATDKECSSLEWSFIQKPDDEVGINAKLVSDMQLFRECVESGLTGATDIAEELGLSKGQISKLAKKAIAAGWLTKDGRDYKPTGQA